MSITLSSADLKKLAHVTQLLMSPLDHESVDRWRSEVNAQLRELLHADSAGFLLPVRDGLALYSDEHDPEELAAYPEIPLPRLSDGTPVEVRMLGIGVARLEDGYGAEYGRYLESAYYNEFALPNRACDNLSAAISLGAPELPDIAALQLWHDRPDGRRFGDREVKLLRLLFPAFRAGVESYLRWERHREDLLHVLDGLDEAAFVCDLDGGVLHRTPALRALLEGDPQAASLRAHLRTMAREASRAAARRGDLEEEPPESLVRVVRTRSARYRMRGCLYGGASAGGAPVAVVGLERLSPAPPSEAELRERFGLTPRQAEVALLLAQRLSNQEIAERLTISPHTALRHTEAVKAKLRVKDRRDVADRLWRREGD